MADSSELSLCPVKVHLESVPLPSPEFSNWSRGDHNEEPIKSLGVGREWSSAQLRPETSGFARGFISGSTDCFFMNLTYFFILWIWIVQIYNIEIKSMCVKQSLKTVLLCIASKYLTPRMKLHFSTQAQLLCRSAVQRLLYYSPL